MKTAFLMRSDIYFRYVYPDEVIAYLVGNAGCDGLCHTKEEVLAEPEKFADTEYIFTTWFMPSFSADEIRQYLPSLKCVFNGAGTVQYFARPFLECGVKVFSAWAANAIPVAEYTAAQIVLANKGFFKASRIKSREGYGEADRLFRKYTGNYRAKVGVIGAGMIGKLVIRKLHEYDVEVVTFDPFLPDSMQDELGVRKVSLEELFSTCNVVSNHLADNPQTVGMLNGALFERMLPYATFLNTGRGAQVVESELCSVLSARPDLTAILDVTSPEPPQDGSPLYSLDNCILTSHIAGSMGNEVHRLAEYMLREYMKYSSGEATSYEVTEKMLETMA